MTPEQMRAILTAKKIDFTEKQIQAGTQFRCKTGEIFSVYQTGKIVPGGKQTELTAEVLGTKIVSVHPTEPPQAVKVQVFVVYGHDMTARNELELMLHRMNVEPIVLGNLPAAGDTIIEKLEGFIGEHGRAAYACVLLTPDDEGYKAGAPDQKRYRARQNVVLELGMVLAKLGRKRVAILLKETVEQPSDIAGLIYVAFKEHVEEAQTRLFQALTAAGLNPKMP